MGSEFKVYCLLMGEFGPVPQHYLFRGGGEKLIRTVPSYMYCIERGRERIVVDTGFSSPHKVRRVFKIHCKRQREAQPEQALLRIGIRPREIGLVVYTHLHWDHAGNSRLFPNATFICQRDELAWALGSPGWEIGYDKPFKSEIMAMLDRLNVVHGDTRIAKGVEVWKLGGHTPGSQAVAICSSNGPIVITGDVVNVYENFTKKIPVGLIHNLGEAWRALEILEQRANIILPSHDWKLYEKYKSIAVY